MPDNLAVVLVPGLNCSPRLYAAQIPELWRFGPVSVANPTRDDSMAAITKRMENLAADVRGQLREKGIRHGGVTREGQTIRVRFRDAATREAARGAILANLPDLALTERPDVLKKMS